MKNLLSFATLFACVALTACSTLTINPGAPMRKFLGIPVCNRIAPGVELPLNYQDAAMTLKDNGFVLGECAQQEIVAIKDYAEPIPVKFIRPDGAVISVTAKRQEVIACFYPTGGLYFYQEFELSEVESAKAEGKQYRYMQTNMTKGTVSGKSGYIYSYLGGYYNKQD